MLSILENVVCVGSAATGREAYLLAARTRPDVILMDVMMPTVDGIATGRAILRVLPRTSIILMSGETGANFHWREALPQAHAFLTKPLDLQELQTALQQATSL